MRKRRVGYWSYMANCKSLGKYCGEILDIPAVFSYPFNSIYF